MKSRITIALGTVVGLVAAAGAAPGTAGTGGGQTLVTTSGDPETGLEISVTAAAEQANRLAAVHDEGGCQPSTNLCLRLTDTEAGMTEDSAYCTQESPTEVTCEGTIASLEIKSGDERDRVGFKPADGDSATNAEIIIDAGSGNDKVRAASSLRDLRAIYEYVIAKGGTGNDVLAIVGGIAGGGKGAAIGLGGAGNDRLIGREGDQDLSGGRGRDFLAGGEGEGDVCKGGPGTDQDGEGCETIVSIP